MELNIELLKLPWMKTTQQLLPSSEVFCTLWNAAANILWNGNMDSVKVNIVKCTPAPVPYAPKEGENPENLDQTLSHLAKLQ